MHALLTELLKDLPPEGWLPKLRLMQAAIQRNVNKADFSKMSAGKVASLLRAREAICAAILELEEDKSITSQAELREVDACMNCNNCKLIEEGNNVEHWYCWANDYEVDALNICDKYVHGSLHDDWFTDPDTYENGYNQGYEDAKVGNKHEYKEN